MAIVIKLKNMATLIFILNSRGSIGISPLLKILFLIFVFN